MAKLLRKFVPGGGLFFEASCRLVPASQEPPRLEANLPKALQFSLRELVANFKALYHVAQLHAG